MMRLVYNMDDVSNHDEVNGYDNISYYDEVSGCIHVNDMSVIMMRLMAMMMMAVSLMR